MNWMLTFCLNKGKRVISTWIKRMGVKRSSPSPFYIYLSYLKSIGICLSNVYATRFSRTKMM